MSQRDNHIRQFSFATVDVEITPEDRRRGFVIYNGKVYHLDKDVRKLRFVRIPVMEKPLVQEYVGKKADIVFIDEAITYNDEEIDKLVDSLYEATKRISHD